MVIKQVRSLDEISKNFNDWYVSEVYGSSISGWFLRKSHYFVEESFKCRSGLDNLLEVGCGPVGHLENVRHKYDHYAYCDLSYKSVKSSISNVFNSQKGVNVPFGFSADCRTLPVRTGSFDRLIACHVLEHVFDPEAAIWEWHRVVRPGGFISILLPCDPGIAWRLGRALGVRNRFKEFPYDYYMAKQHVNSIFNLQNIIYHICDSYSEFYYPFNALPSPDLNLFWCVHIKT